MDTVLSYLFNGKTITILPDPEPEHPRECDGCNIARMVMDHGRYNLPWECDGVSQKNPQKRIVTNGYDGRFTTDYEDCSSWADVLEAVKQAAADDGDEVLLALPVYMLDHSGVSLSTGDRLGWDPFRHLYMGMDSGQVGWVYVLRSAARDVMGWKVITKKRLEQLKEQAENEVEVYGYYLNGDTFGYEVTDENGEEVDSCYGGFYGLEAVEAAAEEAAA